VLSSHFELYNKYANALSNILKDEVDVLENYSIDECFAVICCTKSELGPKVQKLKELVQTKLGITYSFGVSTTKVLAKVASKRNKPNGLCFLIDQDKIDEALKDTKVDNIWGLGFATCRKLNSYKYYTAHDFISKPMPQPLTDMFSKNIFEIKDELLGIQKFKVGNSYDHKKSIQSTRSFIKSTNNKKEVYSELSKNLETAINDLTKNKLYTNRVVCFVKQYVGQKLAGIKQKSKVISHEFNFEFYTQNPLTMSPAVNMFIEHLFDNNVNAGTGLYKSSGIVLSNLMTEDELPVSLFNDEQEAIKDESKSVKLINGLRDKYGFGIISLASSLNAFQSREIDRESREKSDNYEYGLPYKYLGIIS
jgi:nucleotidyltransferase/DNA polymerase involved in DNA repair